MTKTPNPPVSAERPAVPAAVPRVTYTTIEGITTVINAPVATDALKPPTEENE